MATYKSAAVFDSSITNFDHFSEVSLSLYLSFLLSHTSFSDVGSTLFHEFLL